MRSATTSGLTFVGAAQHRGGQSSETYTVKGIEPDKVAVEARQFYRRALEGKQKFWEEELAWILEEFGPEAIRRL